MYQHSAVGQFDQTDPLPNIQQREQQEAMVGFARR
jgi:hypothetical protein